MGYDQRFFTQFGEPTVGRTPANGFRVKRVKSKIRSNTCDFLTAKNRALGISVVAKINTYGGSAESATYQVKSRTKRGGYRIVFSGSSTHDSDSVFDGLYDVAVSSHVDAGYKFTDTYEVRDDGAVMVHCQINGIKVVDVVGLSDGIVDSQFAMVPGAKPFFLCEGWGTGGASIRIITDGEVLFPVARRYHGGGRKPELVITKSFGKATLCASCFGEVDKEAVRLAISAYVDRSFGVG